MSRPFTPLLDRLIARTEVEGSCWVWKGCTLRGYGQIGSGGKRGPILYTHRAMWECLVGSIPTGLQLDHMCKVTRCCNPDHLEPVTSKENTRRSAAGLATGARQRSKTHCPQNHPYDEANTRITRNGRACRTCDRERYWRKKESA